MGKVDFGQVITAMITPFTTANQVAYTVAAQLAEYLVNHGSDAILVCGTTGESPTLTWDEEYTLFRTIKDAVGDRAAVLAGTGSNSTTEAIAATQKAAQLGLDGTLQVVPYYNKPPQAGLYAHFAAIAAACPDLPVMLYNIPGRTGCNLAPETVIKLAQIENIVALKAASGNLDAVTQVRAAVPSNFAIYSGDDSLTLPMLSVGAQGVVSVASHLVGPDLKAMVNAFSQGDVQTAMALHLKLFPLFKGLFCSTNPIPVKAALALQGWSVGGLRPPLCELAPEQQTQLTEVLRSLNLL
ncbi:MAG: 4-hydroxy-tetrahydrodipicolinate synthase [Spirulina sp. SIO3F2]|nr:4-hydroxy-tetrahydrodipicolinate synthase [Spirulina sp. SIO3F2]